MIALFVEDQYTAGGTSARLEDLFRSKYRGPLGARDRAMRERAVSAGVIARPGGNQNRIRVFRQNHSGGRFHSGPNTDAQFRQPAGVPVDGGAEDLALRRRRP